MEYLSWGAAAVAAACALISLYYAKRAIAVRAQTLRDDHDYRRRLHAVHLVEKWDEMTLRARKSITNRWPQAWVQGVPIPWSEIESCRNQQVELAKTTEWPEDTPRVITDHMTTILNYLELVAVSIHDRVADEDILKKTFFISVPRWAHMLADFHDNMQRQWQFDPWEPLRRLVKEWGPDKAKDPGTTGDA